MFATGLRAKVAEFLVEEVGHCWKVFVILTEIVRVSYEPGTVVLTGKWENVWNHFFIGQSVRNGNKKNQTKPSHNKATSFTLLFYRRAGMGVVQRMNGCCPSSCRAGYGEDGISSDFGLSRFIVNCWTLPGSLMKPREHTDNLQESES